MHNHFTSGVKESISYSAEEARRTNSPAITAGHLFLGMLRIHDEMIAHLRTNLGARLADLTTAIETLIKTTARNGETPRPRGMRLFRLGKTSMPSRLPLDREAERLVRHTPEEAGSHEIEPRHLMLAMIHDKDNSLSPILREFQIDQAIGGA